MTNEQATKALEKANDIRTKRAQLRREIAAGELWLPTLLESPPPWLLTESVSRLLVSIRGLGLTKVRRVMGAAKVGPYRQVGDLTKREREALLASLRRSQPKALEGVA